MGLSAFITWLETIEHPTKFGPTATWQILLRKWRFEDAAVLDAYSTFAAGGSWPSDAMDRSAAFTGLHVGAEELRRDLLGTFGDAPLSDQKRGLRFRVMQAYQAWTSGRAAVTPTQVHKLLSDLAKINERVDQIERRLAQ